MRSLILGSVVALSLSSIAACSDGPSGTTTTSVAAATSTTASEPTASLPMTSEMAVDQPIVRGRQFEVTFTGGLRDGRGGYLFVHDTEGEPLALLWDDYLAESPMGYELDPANWAILDYGVSGEASSFTFPSELPAGSYVLCTANSANGGCVAVTAT